MKDYKLAIVIGRFQPFHNSHLELLQQARSLADEVLLIIGSYKTAPNVKNPFACHDRQDMIEHCFKESELWHSTPKMGKVHFEYIRDHFYNDNLWITEVQQLANKYSTTGDSVCLVGSYKDGSSYYLNCFPQWDFIPAVNTKQLHSTDIRNKIYSGDLSWKDDVPPGVAQWIEIDYINRKGGWSDKSMEIETPFQKHQKEFEFLQGYKESWKGAPFAPIFTTVDAVVVQNGHVLVIKRKFNPGSGLFALPGGFLKQNETINAGVFRELKEETGIKVPMPILKSSVEASKVFDYPNRSLRGRTVTHAYCIRLTGNELPEVKGNDDASGAQWMSFADMHDNEDKFYEDHYQMIQYFINKF